MKTAAALQVLDVNCYIYILDLLSKFYTISLI